jgi:hypothetical protein
VSNVLTFLFCAASSGGGSRCGCGCRVCWGRGVVAWRNDGLLLLPFVRR